MKYFKSFIRILSITLFYFVFLRGDLMAIDGNLWLKLSEESKYVLVIGYNAGVSRGAMSAVIEAQKIYAPKTNYDLSKGIDGIVNNPVAKKNYEDMNRIIADSSKEVGLRHDVSVVVEQIDFLYKDPATRSVGWVWMLGLAQDRLEGKDVSSSINAMIKSDQFIDALLKANSKPDFKTK